MFSDHNGIKPEIKNRKIAVGIQTLVSNIMLQ